MPIRNQIEAVVKQLVSAPKFIYGTLAEINKLADAADWTNGVVMLYTLKPITKAQTISQAIDSKFSIYMEFLYKTEFDQYTSQNEVYIQKADSLMEEFLVKLDYYRESPLESRYFKIHNADSMQALPVYNKLDVNSTGMNLALTLDTMNNQNYDPASRPPGYVGV